MVVSKTQLVTRWISLNAFLHQYVFPSTHNMAAMMARGRVGVRRCLLLPQGRRLPAQSHSLLLSTISSTSTAVTEHVRCRLSRGGLGGPRRFARQLRATRRLLGAAAAAGALAGPRAAETAKTKAASQRRKAVLQAHLIHRVCGRSPIRRYSLLSALCSLLSAICSLHSCNHS